MCCEPNCDKQAEWAIYDGDGIEDYTHSCTAHVGELLSDAPEHRVYPLQS
jgi:hypothetical protein